MSKADDPVEGEVLDAAEPTDGSDAAPTDAPNASADDAPEAALHAEIRDLKDRLARARADYDNLQKRQQRDAGLERDRVKGRVLEDFLQVYEYGKMAEFEADRNPGPLAQGVKMVIREFDRLLENNGVRPVGVVGEPFNAVDHDACETQAADGIPAGHVSKVIQTGYRLGERLLRPAKVAVTPGEADADAEGSD